MKTNPNDSLFKLEIKDSLISIGSNLSKREYFAAMAMQGLLADSNVVLENAGEMAIIAADALIAELNKETEK